MSQFLHETELELTQETTAPILTVLLDSTYVRIEVVVLIWYSRDIKVQDNTTEDLSC